MNKRKIDKQRRMALWIIAAGVILIFASLAVGRQYNPPDAVVDSHSEDGQPYPEVARITLEAAKNSYDSGKALILDVRDLEDFEAAHIPNAISMPLSELQIRYQELPKDREILTYCT